MKNLRRDGYFQKKYGKYTGEKWNSSKLDRKSSRGMIYENEELRLRTININAEVERGQSDIRKLRRENEQLRREIWSLRDEYDRLNKLLKTHKTTENDANNSSSQTEESDSCDTCKEEEIDEEFIENDECLENKCNKRKQKQNKSLSNLKIQEIAENYENLQKTENSSSALELINTDEILGLEETYPETFCGSSGGGIGKQKENLHVNFDHLSIVSEENLTNSDGNSVQQTEIEQIIVHGQINNTNNNNNNNCEKQKFIEMESKNFHRLSDIQSVAPPLSHFENIPYDKMGPIMTTSLDDITCSTSTTTTGETVIPANGWDFGVPSYPIHAVKSSDPLKVTSNISQKSLKHFFSPIKPRNRIEPRQSIESSRSGPLMPGASSQQLSPPFSPVGTNSAAIRIGPDVFVSNALASPYHRQNLSQGSGSCFAASSSGSHPPCEPVYATIQKSSSSRTVSPLSFQKGGNLEELLSDIETLSNDILQMQLEKQKSYSQEKLFSDDNLTSNRKPYRSEMNLILSYNGSNPVITPIKKTTISSSTTALDKSNPYNIEGTPPAKLPEPMILFPQNLTYIGFENYNQSKDPTYSPGASKYSKDYEQIHVDTPIIYDVPPPQFHSAGYLPTVEKDLSKICDTEQEEIPVTIDAKISSSSSSVQIPTATISTTPVKNVMRRKFFTKHLDDHQQGTSSRESCDIRNQSLAATSAAASPVPPQGIFDRIKMTRTESSTSENANCDVQSSSGSETIKRKSPRVSILFKRPDDKVHDKSKDKRTTKENTIANKTVALLSESAANLPTAIDSEVMMNKKATTSVHVTHSTPNSPHSGGRRLNHSGSSSHHHHSHHHHHNHLQQHHQSERKSSQDSGSKEPLLGGSSGGSGGGGGGPGSGTGGQLQQQRSKCSRRHSEGTVSGPALSSSVVLPASSSNHGLNDTNYHEPGTSMSERNSNSLASSRESSTSLSMRSQRRKISVSSHNGGKIPWCGCWGNGCV